MSLVLPALSESGGGGARSGAKNYSLPALRQEDRCPAGSARRLASSGAVSSPLPTAPYTPPISAAPGRSLVPRRRLLLRLSPMSTSNRVPGETGDDEPRSRSRYRSRRYGYDDDDDDYDLPRQPARYKPEYSTWAATAGFICSLISIAILVLPSFSGSSLSRSGEDALAIAPWMPW